MGEPALKLEEPEAFAENAAVRRARINRPRWEPKKWHPVYEEIVLLDALGYKNTDIAKEKGFTTVHISNILNTPQAKVLKEILIKRLRSRGEETIEQRLDRLAHKAVDRVEEVLEKDEYASKNPGGIFDRAITLLKVTGKVKDPEAQRPVNTLMVPVEMMQALSDAIRISDEARNINRLPGRASIDTTTLEVKGEVIDADSPA